MRFSYNEALDTGSDLRTRIWGPSLRWNVRTGLHADVGYTESDNRTPALDVRTKTFFASLTLLYR
jgi:hypothetical protein